METCFQGFRRKDKSVGIRNHVAVVSVMDNSNPLVRQICQQVPGTVPVCATFGRGAMGPDMEIHRRILAGMATNPNVHSAVVCGIEKRLVEEIARRIARSDREVETCVIQRDGGTLGATAKGVRAAALLVQKASAQQRENCPLSDLLLGLECGGSDATSGIAGNTVTGLVSDFVVASGGSTVLSETVELLGAEHILARRAVTEEVGRQLVAKVNRCAEYALSLGEDLIGSNPVPDNIEGGLTTIEEKSLGAVKKAGSSPLQEVLEYGVRPSKKGFVFMDGPAPAIENMSGLAAAGVQVIIFYTGQGNHSGHPLVPVIKSCGNPDTLAIMPENIDVDLSQVILGEIDLKSAAELVKGRLMEVLSGRLTTAEILGQGEISISRYALTV